MGEVSEQAAATPSSDARTAAAFAASWNTVGEGSVYTRDQFLDWFRPIDPAAFAGQAVLELGFGNGSLLYHMANVRPARLVGVELGDTFDQARKNLRHVTEDRVELIHGDLTRVDVGRFDLTYCIGVLHHLEHPEAGFAAVLKHTKPGGHFHCWVYGREGNGVVIRVVDPIRRIACKFPWWVNKYGVALPLVIPYFVYAKALERVSRTHADARRFVEHLPLGRYSIWIAQRRFPFFHHVAFDQLVTPRTHYIARSTIESWLRHPEIDPKSIYMVSRNGNSWTFGGRRLPEH